MIETSGKVSASSLNGLSLAFIGDSVYEVTVREYLLRNGSLQVGKLHRMAVKMVCAKAQAQFFDLLEPILSEEESDILKGAAMPVPPMFQRAPVPLNTARQRELNPFSDGFIWRVKTTA